MARLRPDPSFYPSPKLAMEAPAERLAYVALLANGGNGKRDAIGVVDTDPESRSFGRLVCRTEFPQGDILWDFQQHRSGSATAQLGEGAPHEFRHAFDQVDFGAPFGDRLITARRVKIGVHAAPLPRHPGRQQQNGH